MTGIAAPSIDARLVPVLGLRTDIKRMPSFGLGCVAGAAGLARVHDYLLGHPDEIALLVSVELCSLTLQRDDDSVANFVASGLFGDGAAAVVVAGDRRAAELGLPGPEIVGTRSELYPDSESVIGWDIGGTGFRIVLTAAVSDTIDANIGHDVGELLADHGLGFDDVGAWVAHPGGPRVLEAFERGLQLERSDLEASWRSLDAVGNLSSSSVLHVLADMMRAARRHARRALRARAGGHERVRAAALGGLSACPTRACVLFTVFILLTGVRADRRAVHLGAACAKWAFARGGVESGRGHFPAMVALHTGLLVGSLAEVWLLGRPFIPLLGWPMFAIAVLCQVGRIWIIRSLGKQWNTRIIVVPGMPLSRRGPYRWERLPHPNYLLVAVEGLAIPLVHTAFITAGAFAVLNAILLIGFRIPAEDRALKAAGLMVRPRSRDRDPRRRRRTGRARRRDRGAAGRARRDRRRAARGRDRQGVRRGPHAGRGPGARPARRASARVPVARRRLPRRAPQRGAPVRRRERARACAGRRCTRRCGRGRRSSARGSWWIAWTVVEQDSTGGCRRAPGIRADWLLAADGLHSTMARELGLALPAPKARRRYGQRRHYAVEPWSDLIEVHWTRAGEIYVTPTADGMVGPVAAGPAGHALRRGGRRRAGARRTHHAGRSRRPRSAARGRSGSGRRRAWRDGRCCSATHPATSTR